MAGKIKLTDEEIRKNVEDAYGDKYILKHIYRTSNSDVKLIVQCTNCEAERDITHKYFLKGRVICKCMQPKALKACAKEYAKSLYIEPWQGLIVGDELLDYITQCVAYDYPKLSGSIDFIYYIEDELMNIYEKKGVKRCERCGKWYPRTHFIKTNTCKKCLAGEI